MKQMPPPDPMQGEGWCGGHFITRRKHCDKMNAERYVLSLISVFVAHKTKKKQQKLAQFGKKK